MQQDAPFHHNISLFYSLASYYKDSRNLYQVNNSDTEDVKTYFRRTKYAITFNEHLVFRLIYQIHDCF